MFSVYEQSRMKYFISDDNSPISKSDDKSHENFNG